MVKKIIPYIIAVIIGLIWFFVYDRNANEAIKMVNSDFPQIIKSDHLNEIVVETYCPKELRCSAPPVFLILKSKRKIAVNAHKNIDGDSFFIQKISVGDSLVKHSNSDTIYVYEKTGEIDYYLLIRR